MRSFAEYRKIEFKRKIYMVPMKESISCFLEALRIDLLQKVKLPEMFVEGNFILNTTYNHSVKQDYEQSKEIIDSIIRHYDANLYPAIIEEAETAVANSAVSPDPSASFESMLIDKVNAMCDKLIQDVEAALNSARSLAPQDPEEDGLDMGGIPAPTGAGGNAPASASPTTSGTPSSHVPSHASPHAPSSVNTVSGQPHGSMGGTHSPTPVSNGFTPAPMGSLRPADGYRKGFGRLLGGLVPRSWRQAWHNDPTRQMAKEHVAEVEQLLLENTSAVIQLIDSFRKELLQFIQDKSKAIASVAGGGPSLTNPLAGATNGINPAAKSGILPIDTEEEPERGIGSGSSKPQLGIKPGIVNLGSDQKTQTEKQADAGDPAAEAKVNQAYANIKAACETLGMTFSLEEKNHRKEGAWEKHGVKPIEVHIDGKPASELIGSGYRSFIRLLCYKIYEHPELMKSFNKKTSLTPTRKAKMFNRKGGTTPDIFNDVATFLGIKSTGMASKETATEIMQKLGARIRLGQTGAADIGASPDMQQSPADVGASPDMQQSPADVDANAINPTGSNVSRPQITRSKTGVLPMTDNNSSSPEEFVDNFMRNHRDDWTILKNIIGGELSVKKSIAKKFQEGIPADQIETQLFALANKLKIKLGPDNVSKLLGHNSEPERTIEDPSASIANNSAIDADPADPAGSIDPNADGNEVQTPKQRLINRMMGLYKEMQPEQIKELEEFPDDISDEDADHLFNALTNNASEKSVGEEPVTQTDPSADEQDGLTPEEEGFKKHVERQNVGGKVVLNKMEIPAYKEAIKTKVLRPEAVRKILSDLGIDPTQVLDDKPAELLQSPRRTEEPAVINPAVAPTLAKKEPDEAISELLDTRGYGELIKKYRTTLDNGTLDGMQIKAAVNKAQDECENIVRKGGSVKQALSHLQDAIQKIHGIGEVTPVPETPEIINKNDSGLETKPQIAPSTKEKKGKKGGLEGHKDNSPTLGNIPHPSSKKDVSPEEFLKQHPEFAKGDEESHGDADVDPDHIDDGKKRARKKKRLADSTNNFDSIINRFKQRLTENRVDQSKLSASQKLIFS